MNIDSIIVMVLCILALWGVATTALIYSMRKEDLKLQLVQQQRGFEPFSPLAQRDLELWLRNNPHSEHVTEIQELLAYQKQALQKYPRHYYDWPQPTSSTPH